MNLVFNQTTPLSKRFIYLGQSQTWFALESGVVIISQPPNATVAEGKTVTFTVTASATPLPTYQWQSSTDGGSSYGDILGATSSDYSFGPVVLGDSGTLFRVVITNTVDSVTSSAATLTVRLTLSSATLLLVG